MKPVMPSFIIKENQILVSISAKDLSFIVEDHLSHIFSLFAKYGVAVNMMQNSAVSFSACVDNDPQKINALLVDLQKEYSVQYNDNLTLCTIRHYNQADIDRVVDVKKVLLEQKSRLTVQFVY